MSLMLACQKICDVSDGIDVIVALQHQKYS